MKFFAAIGVLIISLGLGSLAIIWFRSMEASELWQGFMGGAIFMFATMKFIEKLEIE